MLSDEISNTASKGVSMFGAVVSGVIRGALWGIGLAVVAGAAWFILPAIFAALTAGSFAAAGTAIMGGATSAGLTGLVGMAHAALGVGTGALAWNTATVLGSGIGATAFTGMTVGAATLGVTSIIPGVSSGFGLKNLIPHRQPEEPAHQPIIAQAKSRSPEFDNPEATTGHCAAVAAQKGGAEVAAGRV